MNVRATMMLLLAPMIASCDDVTLFGDCADTIKVESLSPDGRYVATVFERNCGATTDYSTIVGLREATQPLPRDRQDLVLTLSGRVNVSLAWKSDRTISVDFAEGEVFRKEPKWRDVQISYDD